MGLALVLTAGFLVFSIYLGGRDYEFSISHEWDDQLNALLDRYQPTDIGCYTCSLGGVQVWISNYPYAYGIPCFHQIYPKKSTRRRLKRVIDKLKADAIRPVAEARLKRLNEQVAVALRQSPPDSN